MVRLSLSLKLWSGWVDELTKHRVTGAIIWLSLLIILVPSWYASR